MKRGILVAVFLLLTGGLLWGLTGEEIIHKVDNQPKPKTTIAKMKMILVSKSGSKRVREVVTYIKEDKNMTKTLMKFLSPADIRNTGFLIWDYKNSDKESDQFLYLPALKKTRRISSSQKNQSFLGTDFSYQDMEGVKVNKATHKLLREEKCGNYECYVVESIPKPGTDYQYSKVVEWIRKDIFVPVKAEMYDKKGKKIKRLTVNKLEKIKNYWIMKESVMENLKTHHKTILTIEKIVVDKKIPDAYFTQRYLEKEI